MCKVIWLIYLILSKIRKQINKKKIVMWPMIRSISVHSIQFSSFQYTYLKIGKKKFELRLPVLNLNLLTKDR